MAAEVPWNDLLRSEDMRLPKENRDMLRGAVNQAYAAAAAPYHRARYSDVDPEYKWADLTEEARKRIGAGLLDQLFYCQIGYWKGEWEHIIISMFLDEEDDKFEWVHLNYGTDLKRVKKGTHALRDGKLPWHALSGDGPMRPLQDVDNVCRFLHRMGKTAKIEALFAAETGSSVFNTKDMKSGRRTVADYT